MDLGLLYSAGKDSSLAALALDPFYTVTLVTATFGITDDWEHARKAAETADFDFRTLDLDPAVAEAAVDRMIADGFPRNAIQQVHTHALERLAAGDFDAIGDGTRRDDRVPAVSRAQAQSLEDRHGIDYVAPLTGFGRGAIDRLVDARLVVESGPSEAITRADYEAELRALLAKREGRAAVEEVFPDHEQSYVTGFR
ncbi:alpha hydrolase [Halalkalicoccus jeotgali]|uniref:Asparagine synthetase domain-containing protein n=1 Tax=Halalkalicoccus jeotgali (strain DSM 18796 / CECT 7217 / JCM 14584 / KCTC 4019 / B3) TaxID=795797 RepID=D8J8Q9_HALJB|nr:alpha hydrolase [Halalkalicoccus jeotgali]ADJ14244.1 hypothetical protein HacjB3_04265 [Halalkalicoccus jeotgali B3]ELY40506.1 hypothetical protein C497_02627 [Halalkalicoccus jeotgali B3]